MTISKEAILNSISNILGTQVDENSTQESTPSWDSLKHIQLIMELEEVFDLTIPIEKVPDLISVQAFINYISEKEF